MNNQIFKIKRNDTLPELQLNITTKGNLGQKIGYDLSGATGVTFTMIDGCSNTKVYNQDAEILCASGGTIQYSWQDGDTDTEGIYYGEFQIKFSSGKRLSVPTQNGIKIEVLKDINPF